MVGIVLLFFTLATGTYGLPKVDKNIYAEAVKLDEKVNGFGFSKFSLKDYTVRFFDGNVDYVVKGDDIDKQKAVFETFVGTTVEVDGEYQVLLPTYEKFSQMFSTLAAAGSVAEGELSFEEDGYTMNAHIATLWHEAFHAWQFTNKSEQFDQMALQAGIAEGTNYSDIIVNEIDANDALVQLFTQEMQILNRVWEEEELKEKKELLQQVFTIQQERQSLLSEQTRFIEQYYQMVEGSAQYVESCVYEKLEGQTAWKAIYMKPFVYEKGNGKYYTMGNLKCRILDQIAPNWKETFDATESLDVLLRRAIEY